MNKYIILIALLLVSLPTFAQIDTNTVNWTNDIEVLRTELPKNHKNFFFKRSKQDFNNGLDQLLLKTDRLTDFEIAMKLQQLIASFGDSHTQVGWGKYLDRTQILPIVLYWFENDIYIVKATKKHKVLLGKKINSINTIPISAVIDSISTLITVDNPSIVKHKIPDFMCAAQLLEHFKFGNDGKYILEVEDMDGETQNYIITSNESDEEYVGYNADSLAFCWQNRRIAFSEHYFENEKIYYLKYNSCTRESKIIDSEEIITFSDYTKTVLKTLKKKEINKVIFDMRFNGGGSSLQGTLFIRKLAKQKKYNQEGKFFVIVGRRTFSSAVLNTLDFKKHTKAIIVGEETSGKPNHYGEVKKLELPSSKLGVYYSVKYFKHSDIDFNTIEPDVKIESSIQDYINGIDPVYEWIMKQ